MLRVSKGTFYIYMYIYKNLFCVCACAYMNDKVADEALPKILSSHKDNMEVSQHISVQEGIIFKRFASWLWAFYKPNCPSSFSTKPPQHCSKENT